VNNDRKTQAARSHPSRRNPAGGFHETNGNQYHQLARDLAVPHGRISGIVNGRRAISADTALRLGKYFGVSPETWIGLQADYDLRIAQRTTWPEIEKRIHTRVA